MAKRRSKKTNTLITVLVILLSAICILLFGKDNIGSITEINKTDSSTNSSFKISDYAFSVSFIDVGQGDCELIYCNGKTVLTDGGEAANAQSVIDFLADNEISSIDYYILTHPHSDHIGAAAGIIKAIPCKNVVMTDFSDENMPTTKVFEKVLDAIDNNNCTLITVEAGDKISVGELTLDILSPKEETDDYNDMSIVYTATYLNTAVLITGDATVNVEEQLLSENADINADILKVSHHGSSTSSSDEFISEVSPLIAVISCGKDNQYGHPHNEVVKRFSDRNISLYRTDISGSVVCYGDGIDINVKEID